MLLFALKCTSCAFWVVFLVVWPLTACSERLNGRYTRSIEKYQLSVPKKTTRDGKFDTWHLKNTYTHDFTKSRNKRSSDDPEMVHYSVTLQDGDYFVDLWPNHGFLSPNMVFEKREARERVQNRDLKMLQDHHHCHYTGKVRGFENSKVALSTCDGLAGYITINGKRLFIEPVDEHEPNEEGQHLHVVYEHQSQDADGAAQQQHCGTSSDRWQDIWKKRLKDNLLKNEGHLDRRGLTSEHRYLETLVVCDKKFLTHHRHRDYELYVLTIMNMVSDFYHDASSGNQMDVVVVRIMYLEKEEEEIDLIINQDATATLASFCKWQEKINPKDLENPNHHDIAVLLTRYDICADGKENCGLMGLAYVASACTSNEPCAINEDGGLVLAIVVAHEMGHVMGCAHDKEGESTCPAQDTDESYFVMAPFVHLYTTRWSTCSRAFMTALFENNLGECLNDEPQTSLYSFRNALPGTIYDANVQCDLDFPNSTICLVPDVKFCETLLCRTSPEECLSKEEPPADGTKCGPRKWCFRKECVEIGDRPEAVNGGWGAWGSWSACSRTCGGGVMVSERNCDNPEPKNKGRYCLGDRKKVKTCNMEPCEQTGVSFREIQCAEHNEKEFDGKKFHWKAFFKEDEPCVLYCLNDLNAYSKLEPRAKDGTRCRPGTKDMCIAGVCKKIGCDGEIESEAVEDVCGICNGDGTQCHIIESVYSDVGAINYKKIATIPSGSRNIRFEELGSSINTLAVSDQREKKFFLNGDNTEGLDGPVFFGKAEGVYTHPEPGKELLVIPGPLFEDINLFVVFYKMENVGYLYKYAEMSADLTYTPHYQWDLLEWGECSKKCGGGFQSAQFDCVEAKAGKVSRNFCLGLDKPEEPPKTCNEQPCKTKWKVGQWEECRPCRDKPGIKMREVVCVREAARPGTEDVLVEDAECLDIKPASQQLCNSKYKCGKKPKSKRSQHHKMTMPNGAKSKKQPKKSIRVRQANSEEICDMTNECKECTPEQNTTRETTTKIHLDVGKVVVDRIPEEEIKLLRVPIKSSPISGNLTDAEFEKFGDSIGDRLDAGEAVETTGKKAVKALADLQEHKLKPLNKTKKKQRKQHKEVPRCPF